MSRPKKDAMQEYINFRLSCQSPKFVYAIGDILLIGHKASSGICEKLKAGNSEIECEDLKRSGECDCSCTKIPEKDIKQIEQALPTLLKDLETEYGTPPAIRFDPIATQEAQTMFGRISRRENKEPK